jgi:hypothetical protein
MSLKSGFCATTVICFVHLIRAQLKPPLVPVFQVGQGVSFALVPVPCTLVPVLCRIVKLFSCTLEGLEGSRATPKLPNEAQEVTFFSGKHKATRLHTQAGSRR